MKIALVNDIVYGYASGDASVNGGAERYAWLLTRALVARGWSATIGVQNGLKRGQRVRIDGVDCVGLGPGHQLRLLYGFLVAEKPDWCYWFGASHLVGPAMVIGRLARTRGVFSTQFDLDVHPRRALHARPGWWPLYALGLSQADRILLQHDLQYLELPAAWRAKASVTPGVVTMPQRMKPHVERDRYVAWVGVQRQPKRPDRLIEIARQCPSIEFVVCGGASDHRSPAGYSATMIGRLQSVSNIRYLGHVSPAKALEVIGGASLLLSTSEGEGYPSVFLEAWASGTPVVSLQIDPDQTLSKHALGVLSGSVEGAARDIEHLVESVQRRQEIGERARDYVARFHSEAAAVSAVERALGADAPPALQQSHAARS